MNTPYDPPLKRKALPPLKESVGADRLPAWTTRSRLRIALAAGLAYAVIVGVLAALWPRGSKGFAFSFGWWLFAIPLWLAAYAGLELFCNWSLELPFWERMPSWLRILVLASLVSCGAVGAMIVAHHFGALSGL